MVASSDSSSPSTPRQTGSERHQSASSGNVDCESDVEYYDDCWMDPLHKLGGGSILAKLGQPSGNPSGITQSFTPLDWMVTESDLPRADPYQCPPAGGEDLLSPADGGGFANDANVDRPADLPVSQQWTAPLGEQKEYLQSSGEAELDGPVRVDPPTAFRRRQKTR